MTGADAEAILGYIDGRLSTVATLGRRIPAPLYFKDKRDYLASYDAAIALDTQQELETTLIRFCSFSYKNFTDDPLSPAHSPTRTLSYKIYLFSEYDVERESESANTLTLERRMLRRHQEFIEAICDILTAFQGDINIGVLDPAVFARAFSQPLAQIGDIQEQVECVYVPGVHGLSVEFQLPITVRLKEC